MGLLTPKKGDKKGNKTAKPGAQDSKFIKKPGKATGFTKKQGIPGAKRGS